MAAADSSRSSSTADSYIGSLISLTSKSEIRYEGILYNINTEESSIGLRNVRSFGTEGRKKDGPQVGPSDKVYEYILFRGSDIKDLQVKSSPPPQSTAPINSDPAIIQSHYPRAATTTSSLPAAAASGSSPDISSQTAQMGHPGSTFQGGLPLYQPGGNMGSWGPSPPPPNANGSGLAMPMYWPGFYGPPTGLPQLHQQSLLRPPPGLSMPPSMQQPMQYPGFNTSLPSAASNLPSSNLPTSNFPNLPSSNLPTSNIPAFNLPTSNMPAFNLPTSNLPEYPSPLLPTSSASLTTASFPGPTMPSSLPPAPSISLQSETLPSVMTNKAPVPLGGSLPSLSPLTTSTPESNKSNVSTGSSLPYQGIPHPISTIVGTSAIQAESPTPSLITPGQLLHSGQGPLLSSQSSQVAHKDVEVVQVAPTPSLEPLAPAHVPTEAQPPILPLPTPSRTVPKMNGAPYQNRHNNYRGRERGRGTATSRPVMKFTEEFDFTAMNEKFNKDEVWGHLGKSNKSNSKEKVDGNVSDEDEYEDEDDTELSKSDSKPVYSKDDFFDTLSCNALDNQNNGRTRFSEQMKLDTETFGEFSRYRGGRGGRGPYRGGGRSRGGSYYGRGYGYNGRGRGGRTSNRDY